jgi:hypothetical protein
MSGAGAVSARQVFGDWGIACDGKVVALTTDSQLYASRPCGRTFAVGFGRRRRITERSRVC